MRRSVDAASPLSPEREREGKATAREVQRDNSCHIIRGAELKFVWKCRDADMENFAEDDLGGEDYKGRSIKESARKQELVTSYGKQTKELGYYMRGDGILHKLLGGICDGEGDRGRKQQKW